MENIKIKNGMKNFIVITFISSWLVQLFSFVQGHTRNFRDDYSGCLTTLLFSATTHTSFDFLGQDHGGGIDFQHDIVRKPAVGFHGETDENHKNKQDTYSELLEMASPNQRVFKNLVKIMKVCHI